MRRTVTVCGTADLIEQRQRRKSKTIGTWSPQEGFCTSVAIPSTATPNLIILRAVSVLAVMLILTTIVVRRLFVLRSEAALAAQPSDSKALARWRVGYLLTYILSEGIALYGVVLHFLGFALAQVTPFFLTGFVLLVFFCPRGLLYELVLESRDEGRSIFAIV